MINDKINEILFFTEGVSSVCDDSNVIAEKTMDYFGKKNKRIVDYVLWMKTRTFSAEQFAKILSMRDFSEGLSDVETACSSPQMAVIRLVKDSSLMCAN